MPIPVGSMKTICQSCGWSKVTRQRSDVLLLPSQCESCGSKKLVNEAVGGMDGNLVSVILDMLKK